MRVCSSGFSILPEMGHVVKGFGQLGQRRENWHKGAINLALPSVVPLLTGLPGMGKCFIQVFVMHGNTCAQPSQ
jgi:hypothetical protein